MQSFRVFKGEIRLDKEKTKKEKRVMKKTKALLIAALLVCFVVVFTVVALTNSEVSTEKESEGLSFDSNGEGTCFVAGLGECADTRIVIPSSSPDGDRVTGIGSGAFAGRTELEKVA